MAETKIPPRPPAAVAVVCTIEFSLGPNEPPRMGKFSPRVRLKNVRIAKPNIAPNKFAPNPQPVFRPALIYLSALSWGGCQIQLTKINIRSINHPSQNTPDNNGTDGENPRVRFLRDALCRKRQERVPFSCLRFTVVGSVDVVPLIEGLVLLLLAFPLQSSLGVYGPGTIGRHLSQASVDRGTEVGKWRGESAGLYRHAI
jgi:hypothetical protein